MASANTTGDKYKIMADGQIKALRDFGAVKAGDKGGYVGSADNLSQTGCCWIAWPAVVAGDAVVINDAIVSGATLIHGTATVCGGARVSSGTWCAGTVGLGGGGLIAG